MRRRAFVIADSGAPHDRVGGDMALRQPTLLRYQTVSYNFNRDAISHQNIFLSRSCFRSRADGRDNGERQGSDWGGTSGTLNLSLTTTCATNQVLQWNGTAWACANLKGNGTITGVAAGTALTGGGTSGNVTLNLDTTKVPLLSAANTFVGNQAVTGNPTATGSISAQTASLNESGTTNALTINQTGGGAGLTVSAPISLAGILSDSANIGVWGIASSVGGSGVEGETANGNGVYGVDTATSGTVGGPAWRDLQFRWLLVAHRIQVEVEKPSQEQGRYLHPELYGAPAEQGIGYKAQAAAAPASTNP